MVGLTTAIIGGGASIISGLIGGSAAKKRASAAAAETGRLKRKLSSLENSRQAIINPYAGASNLSDLATDLSDRISNPMANLSVATKAAEMKVEQSDIALANTLDTIRATGGGAGGATALAQAALQAKQGVSASIEQQEKSNEDKRAAGEAQMEQAKLAEARRQQGIGISEGQRMQGLDAAGKQFQFGQRENREMQALDRTASLLGASNAAAAQASADQTSALTGTISSLGSIAGGLFS
mgnify:FL=1|tara:strand:+ start:607 stop:1323 length:717 start_codon:yes stop_codon:yes gene_type:complete